MRVCFVGPKCYDLLVDSPKPRYFGGAERQQVLVGRGLAARGHQVSFVTFDYGQHDTATPDGIRVYSAYATDAGWPGLRFVHPRWTGLCAAMQRANADLYYQMGGDSETGQVASWCDWRSKRFVFCMASDGDADPELPFLKTRRQRILYRWGLHRAHAVVAQTVAQQQRLLETFHTTSVVVRNCTPDPGFDPAIPQLRAQNARPRLLWVGRFVAVKRLELLLDLAAARPDWDFHVVGGGDDRQEYVRDLQVRASALSNVSVHRGISDSDLNDQYSRANLLVCTSIWEGVPTTFLEAWARGLPVVSTIDPDGVIAGNQLGAAATAATAEDAILDVLGHDAETTALRVRQHFLATHTVEASAAKHETLFRTLTGDNVSTSRATSSHAPQ